MFPPDLIAQAHFKVGYGFKLTGNLIMIPALETPDLQHRAGGRGLRPAPVVQ